MPQFSGWRARRGEKSWRLWQAEHEPREPSRFSRPIPVLGQVLRSENRLAALVLEDPRHGVGRGGTPFGVGRQVVDTVIIPPSVARKATLEPWHCWQPVKALAMPLTCVKARPGVGE